MGAVDKYLDNITSTYPYLVGIGTQPTLDNTPTQTAATSTRHLPKAKLVIVEVVYQSEKLTI